MSALVRLVLPAGYVAATTGDCGNASYAAPAKLTKEYIPQRSSAKTRTSEANPPVNLVSQRLGHSGPAFTKREYQHVLPGMRADDALALATAE